MTKAEQGRPSGTYSSIWPARRQARRGGFLFPLSGKEFFSVSTDR
jgi:hypothetical protein